MSVVLPGADADGERADRQYYAAIRLFQLGETDKAGRAYHRTSAMELCGGRVAHEWDADEFSWIMPIGTLTYAHSLEDGEDVNLLALRLDPRDDNHLYIEIETWKDGTLDRAYGVNKKCTLFDLLESLVNQPE